MSDADCAARIVLLIEDDDDTLELYAYVLGAEAFHVIAARSTTEAIAISAQQRPSIVVTDLFVPGSMSPAALCRRFSDGGVPVLAVTGIHRGPRHDEIMHAGCAAVLVKPVSPGALVTEIRRVLAMLEPSRIAAKGTTNEGAHLTYEEKKLLKELVAKWRVRPKQPTRFDVIAAMTRLKCADELAQVLNVCSRRQSAQ